MTTRKGKAKSLKTSTARGAHHDADDESESGSPRRHALWSGSISFGLLQIPVNLFPAEARNELSFHQLDRHDLGRIGYKRVHRDTGKEVAWNDIVKGYEYEPGRFVVLTDEDFKNANVEATQTIDIRDFVDAAAIHPTYFDTPYYLAPDKRAHRAYAVLREALRRTGKAAVATLVIRTREHLAAIMVEGDALLLETLRYAHELRTPDDLDLPHGDLSKMRVSAKEIELAERLVSGMIARWEPSQYRDTYRDDLLKLIEQKARTGSAPKAKSEGRGATASNVVDMMRLLKKSVQGAEATRNGEGGKRVTLSARKAARRGRTQPSKRGSRGGRAA